MPIKSVNAIRGSTKIVDLLRAFPDGQAMKLMSKLGWACACCSASAHEPLSLAAKRHGNPILLVIECFRALYRNTLSEDQISQAAQKRQTKKYGWIQYIQARY